MIKVDDFIPLIIRAGGISALPVRQLITQLRLNKALRHDYHKAVISITGVKKKTSAGEAYTLHPKIKTLITDESKAQELKNESLQLLGSPVALPEARPEDEPIAYTPEGKPVYTEEEKQQVATELESETTPPVKPAPEGEERKEPSREEPLDLDF